MDKIPITNTTKSQVNPNFQIPTPISVISKFPKFGSIGVLDLFGSIGIYWDLGFFRANGGY